MKDYQHWVLYGSGVAESQHKSDRAPDAEEDEDNRDEDQLLVSYRHPRRASRGARKDGAVLGECCVLHERNKKRL